MAWRFRKSIKLGPLRFNLSKSGVGTSIGVRGFRVGTDAKGRSYTAASIPGTGLYNRTYSGKGTAAGVDAAPGSGTPLVMAFIAGGLLVLFLTALFSSHPVTPPAMPPAAVSAPVAPPQPIPVKRKRAHRSKPDAAPVVRQANAGERNKTQPNAQPPAN